jgi:hypothetical protein
MPSKYTFLILIVALVMIPLACGSGLKIQDELKDPAKTLQVVVTSKPSGAEVYGISGGKPGKLLGTTPLTCSYMVIRSGNSPEIFSNVSVSETIASDLHLPTFVGQASYYTFQCIVSKEGYKSAVVQKPLVDQGPINIRQYSTSDAFKAGHRVEVAVTLPPLGADEATAGM